MQYIIATHGNMASGVKSSLKMLMGEREDVHVIDAYLEDDEPEAVLNELINHRFAGEEIIIMTDLYGGSVNRIATQFVGEKVMVVAGVNLALVMELIFMDDVSIESVEASVAMCREQMKLITAESLHPTTQADEDFF